MQGVPESGGLPESGGPPASQHCGDMLPQPATQLPPQTFGWQQTPLDPHTSGELQPQGSVPPQPFGSDLPQRPWPPGAGAGHPGFSEHTAPPPQPAQQPSDG